MITFIPLHEKDGSPIFVNTQHIHWMKEISAEQYGDAFTELTLTSDVLLCVKESVAYILSLPPFSGALLDEPERPKHPFVPGDISVKTFNTLQNSGYFFAYYEDIAQISESTLLKLLGRKSFNEIKDILAEMGLEIKK
jgi:hypothetical protein